ncbi:hypothetical protein [Paraburkholderia fungorum]|uniref:hypothetical protein n=1 Tax=Paraburkholderia fungorum TaxID=134537 RepID=UPI00161F4B29|nr:hypothetical protein [Paraburkholderia fungorum]MBB5546654.1 hypothetical protein [Paraburkholderia fungorum]
MSKKTLAIVAVSIVAFLAALILPGLIAQHLPASRDSAFDPFAKLLDVVLPFLTLVLIAICVALALARRNKARGVIPDRSK